MKVGVKIVRWMLTSSLDSFAKHLNENSKLKITHPQLGSLALNEKNSLGSKNGRQRKHQGRTLTKHKPNL